MPALLIFLFLFWWRFEFHILTYVVSPNLSKIYIFYFYVCISNLYNITPGSLCIVYFLKLLLFSDNSPFDVHIFFSSSFTAFKKLVSVKIFITVHTFDWIHYILNLEQLIQWTIAYFCLVRLVSSAPYHPALLLTLSQYLTPIYA